MEGAPGEVAPEDLPEMAGLERLCRRRPRPSPPRRHWWLPTVGFSAERSLRLTADGAGFSDATTFWVTLAFPFPSGERAAAPPVRRRADDLCAAAARLNRALATVGDRALRTRASLQLLAWRDELEALTE
jgi:hypothetical protein